MSNARDDIEDEPNPEPRRRWAWWPAAAIVVVALIVGAVWDGPTKGVDIYTVHDGDTLEWTPRDCVLSKIGLACLAQRLRLYGVDAFERKQACRDGAGKRWPCGAVATKRLAALTARPSFACSVDNEFMDRHAREFAVCTVDGKDVGSLLVSEGLAFYYGRGLQYLPIEAEARRLKRGAWAGSFVRPQFWRQGARG
ncbi:MAG TPA: thermonuclease family protein [Stellaceae bacterium]|jgi:endonuclease YncB( thermonuclease family)|nr:thermonuclease family protein [Stellaceae bacterium]